ncbi:hypothetical protein [Conexibacter arvalis]|uniref:Uncharacterized protein n=1 Tax=Conexibacter arvalis TaxID=912552 RepID=A0A840I837_9ACTN|nr:hypothetical protein [Conexibacter arvalis]MBB4661069.1 hypothetical protein [Conexibacter arvalis]
MTALDDLGAALRAEGGLLAAALAPPAAPDPHAELVAAGPRARQAPAEYGLVFAAVREGYLLHYGDGRVVRPDDPDLGLLGGDRLYALGLARLAALGDLEAVAELADLISLCAQAHADGDVEEARRLADAAWAAAATAVGHGPSDAHARAKDAARSGDADAPALLLAVADAPDRP